MIGADAQHVSAAVMPMVPLGRAAHEKVVCLASLAVEVERSVSAPQLVGCACPRPTVGSLGDEAPKPLIFGRARGALRPGVKATAPLQSLVVHEADLADTIWGVGRVRVAVAFVNGTRRIISSQLLRDNRGHGFAGALVGAVALLVFSGVTDGHEGLATLLAGCFYFRVWHKRQCTVWGEELNL